MWRVGRGKGRMIFFPSSRTTILDEQIVRIIQKRLIYMTGVMFDRSKYILLRMLSVLTYDRWLTDFGKISIYRFDT